MTVSLSPTGTHNRTHPKVIPVIRDEGCLRCDELRRLGRPPPDWERHCTTCHERTHYACDDCGACLSRRARSDRRYCSSTCRVRSWQTWRAEKAEWDRRRAAGDPEVLAAEAQDKQLVETIRAISALGDAVDGARALTSIQAKARETAETCAICGVETPATQPVWRRPEHFWRLIGDGQTVLPVCFGCRCETFQGKHQTRHCEQCGPEISNWKRIGWICPDAYSRAHKERELYCHGCHPRVWRNPKPCEHCGRQVADSIWLCPSGRTVWRPDPDRGWAILEVRTRSRVFCSARCRRAVYAAERKHADRTQRPCQQCAAVFTGRADARYCSAGCRQAAHRVRVALGVSA
jgi:hypothetical protein